MIERCNYYSINVIRFNFNHEQYQNPNSEISCENSITILVRIRTKFSSESEKQIFDEKFKIFYEKLKIFWPLPDRHKLKYRTTQLHTKKHLKHHLESTFFADLSHSDDSDDSIAQHNNRSAIRKANSLTFHRQCPPPAKKNLEYWHSMIRTHTPGISLYRARCSNSKSPPLYFCLSNCVRIND